MNSKTNKIDVVICSKELKKLIRQRIKDLNTNLYYVCKIGEFDYKKFSNFMNAEDPMNNNVRVKQMQVIKLCESIGVDVRISIRVNTLTEEMISKFKNE
tara:strand:- start:267 stop:563 length:297 start_codon:yes stop_codon:yes gene_type:complete